MDNGSEAKIAVLIDAENTHFTVLDAAFKDLSKHGRILVKKAYGDWSSPKFNDWKKPLSDLAINFVQQTSSSSACRSSDSSMIIDAMDLLYSNKFDAFALVSSGCGLTKLASRLKESALYVFGIGEKHTPIAFRNVVDDFVYVEVFKEGQAANGFSAANQSDRIEPEHTVTNSVQEVTHQDTELPNILKQAAMEYQDEDGWSLLAHCGGLIKRQYPDFSAKNYGFSSLSQLVEATELFEIALRETESGVAHIYIKERA